MRLPLLGVAIVVGSVTACRPKEVVLEWEPVDAFSSDERHEIADIAEGTVPEVRRLLPAVARPILLHVSVSKKVTAETGESAEQAQPNYVAWQVDPSRPGGVAAIVRAQLRPMLFHELHHLVRATQLIDTKLKEHIVREGLASAFERDAAGVPQPWTEYPPEVDRWAAEVFAVPDDAPRSQWLLHLNQPDGRRWLGYRVGTYVVDRAMRASGKSAADLVHTPTDAILEMAGIVARHD